MQIELSSLFLSNYFLILYQNFYYKLLLVSNYHSKIEMATNISKARDTRKAKTSILFEVKNNVDQNVEISQSINIISLNTPAKYIKTSASQNANSKPQYYSNGNINSKNNGRRAHHSGKLTIKLSSGNCIPWDDHRNPSVYKSESSKKIEVADMIEKFQKRNLIIVQRNRIISQITSFSVICTEFVEKIDGLKEQNCQLTGKVKKYENYFKQLKIKQVPEAFDTILEPTKCQKNAQLKILNLERKVQTLAYIIKNYRQNNKEEVKQFEKRMFEYRPSIESQLVEMLGQANKKNEDLRKTVQYFEQEYKKYCREGNWVELAMKLKEKDEAIKILQEKLGSQEQQKIVLKQQNVNLKAFEIQSRKLSNYLSEQQIQSKELKQMIVSLRQSSNKKDELYQNLLKNHEELTFQFQGVRNIQMKYKQKEETVKKNLVTIARLQNQNNQLKCKISKILEIDHSQEPEGIQKCNLTIDQLTNRFWEQMDKLPSKNGQSVSFLSHLYDKTKSSFQKIVDDYRRQIKELTKQKKQLKSLLQSIIEANNKKLQFTQEMVEEVKNIQSKRNRCRESQLKIQICSSCPSCSTWASHWGQINHLYNQLEGFVHKLSQIS